MKRIALTIMLLIGAVISQMAQDYVFLSDLEPLSAEARWFGYVKDKIHDMYPLILQGIKYDKGILTHAPAKVEFELGRKFEYLTAQIGLWDSGKRISQDIYKNNERDWRGPGNGVVYEVWCDGTKKFESGIITWQNDSTIKIAVKNVEKITLIVTTNGDTDSDWAVWADAKLIY